MTCLLRSVAWPETASSFASSSERARSSATAGSAARPCNFLTRNPYKGKPCELKSGGRYLESCAVLCRDRVINSLAVAQGQIRSSVRLRGRRQTALRQCIRISIASPPAWFKGRASNAAGRAVMPDEARKAPRSSRARFVMISMISIISE